MKKLVYFLGVVIILLVTSCEGGKRCPAYENISISNFIKAISAQ